MGDIRYEEALAKYREAYAIGETPALLYNMGRALEALSRYPEALEMMKAFDAKATPELRAKVPNLQKLIEDIANRTCLLTIEATKGATIKMGDVVLGKAPLAEVRVNAGKAVKLEATLEGHELEQRQIDLPGGGKAKVDFKMIPKDKTGILAIDSPVKGATVVVDDLPAKQVPTEVRVAAGTHTVKLTATGYRDNIVDVEVAVGQRKQVLIEPGEPPVYERWWFWTITGLVVAGAAAGIVSYAMLTEGPADEGDIPPCQVVIQVTDEGECEPETAALRPLRGAGFVPAEGRARGFVFGPVPIFTVQF